MFGKQREPRVEPVAGLDIAALRVAGVSVDEIDALISGHRRMAAYNQGCADREQNPKLRAAFVANYRQLMGEVDQLLDLRLQVSAP